MKTRFRNLTAFVLALVMALTMLPLGAFAAAEEQNGANLFQQVQIYGPHLHDRHDMF